ncbi:hypothetical protein Brms1b_013332 [Colletotrichum noveboracense]|nr:hypothetical protein CBS470a_009219 [Colletotrichum nupharicola]KAJ0298584.1 hypothetical protein Brms1b_013332 [Colletotrichum noveboracense]
MATKGDHEVQHLRKAAENEVEEKLGQSAIFEAKQASDDEHAQTLMQALSQNRKAVFWSVMISMSIVMEGYDVILINNFFAYPEFQKKYGSWYGDEIGYQVSGPWQTGLTMAATTGAIFGGLMNGFFASKYGYRWVMIVAMGFLNCFIFVVFFAHSAAMLLVGQILCGFSWGVFATLSPAYDRLDEARRSIERLSGDKTQDQINAQLAMMVHTTKVEAGVTSGVSYKDCFKGVDLRRTEICCIAFAGQVMSGSSFAYTPTYFFTTAGMNTANAFELSLGAKGMAFIGTCL